jgi:hypothetical protein
MLASRLKRVAARKPLLSASLAEVYRVCGKPSCRCHQEGPKHRAAQLTYTQQGKTHAVYVPVDFTEEVRSWVEEYRRLKRLLQEISQLSLALVRSHVQERKRRRGRS